VIIGNNPSILTEYSKVNIRKTTLIENKGILTVPNIEARP
jgi:hypothetical protein